MAFLADLIQQLLGLLAPILSLLGLA